MKNLFSVIAVAMLLSVTLGCRQSVGIKRKQDVEIPKAQAPAQTTFPHPALVPNPNAKNGAQPDAQPGTQPEPAAADPTSKPEPRGFYYAGLTLAVTPDVRETLGPARRALVDAVAAGRGFPHDLVTDAWLEREFEKRGEKLAASRASIDAYLTVMRNPAGKTGWKFADFGKTFFERTQEFHGGERIKGSTGADSFLDTVRRNEISDSSWLSVVLLVSRSVFSDRAYEDMCPVVVKIDDVAKPAYASFGGAGDAAGVDDVMVHVMELDWNTPQAPKAPVKLADLKDGAIHATPYMILSAFDDLQNVASGSSQLGASQLSHRPLGHAITDPVRLKQAQSTCDWVD